MGDQSEAIAGLLPEPNAHAVADVKALDLDPLVVEDDAAVGQHPVDVGEDQVGSACNVARWSWR